MSSRYLPPCSLRAGGGTFGSGGGLHFRLAHGRSLCWNPAEETDLSRPAEAWRQPSRRYSARHPRLCQSGAIRKKAQLLLQRRSRKVKFVSEVCSAAQVVPSHSWMEATMPSGITRWAIGALALGTAALALAAILFGMAALVSGGGQGPVNAPQLSSAGSSQDADFRLSDHQQLRGSFFRGPRDRLR
jgi:hypothetical protein